MSNRRSFGTLRKLNSGNWQARYVHPQTGMRHSAPVTYKQKADAQAWLNTEQHAIEQGTWRDTKLTRSTLNEYGLRLIAQRDLKAPTREDYLSLWRNHIEPTLGRLLVSQITPELVRNWKEDRLAETGGAAYAVKNARAVLRMILAVAVEDNILTANPCNKSNSVKALPNKREPLTPAQVAQVATAIPEHYSCLVLILGWIGLRIGEATALRLSDLYLDDPAQASLRIERRVKRLKSGELDFDTPKSAAGLRTIAIPPQLVPVIQQHLARYSITDPDSLVFPTKFGQCAVTAAPQEITRVLREQGYATLRTHDLRATAATAMTSSGVSLVQVMQVLGHSTVNAAMGYQRATAEASRNTAQLVGEQIILPPNVIPIRKAG